MTRAPFRLPAPVRIVFAGQSHNQWPPFGYGDDLGPYPNRLMRFFPNLPWHNAAHGGHGWAELALTFDDDVVPQARHRDGCTDVLIMSGGQSDIYEDDKTGAETYALAVAYAQAARGAGFQYVLVTTMPAFGPGGSIDPTPDMLQARIDHNTLMMADAGNDWDGVADWHSHPALADATNTTYFENDFVHFKPAAADVAAFIVEPILRELVNSL
jgi:hypothetical protein